ncbi:MAG: penicillin-binding protein 1C [Hoeflea sp.]|uniref:penicillin-binding protein 1C n=1 Tax=Hoeflea sp. TaxID=1940281 RepID=UPI001E13FBE4|nr:penicillin-binding protein 1C [Hoeflea sp.]MBU4529528.1 penicillin-binding protein 1C [Alphaproteobacteria bacterium]MBU4546647.1 penicillin-binding protein 1C [Alphaproteobacteria bacterium]MBU4550915.1 penicillin-binding protein 1C [Alphaproteobacteria bacterium]MBV1723857.1 penicillin-binding protein 1C [Hoeflea sp.]MBV1763134.1 penicillin-binding protein 1C [Hoeflea sp.]
MTRPRGVKVLRLFGLGAAVCVVASGLALFAFDRADKAYPPPLEAANEVSREVLDRDGGLLRAYTAAGGVWRLPVQLDEVDPDYINMLIAYEDRRFRSHHGVDPVALLRAALQFAGNGRIVSGGSTITMQLARLIEPRTERSLTAKLRQMARALQIERRLSKDQILSLYLTLAPYGGNLEGVRAASLAWFGREPRKLTLSQSALLVALPQSPESRRPDRHQAQARLARDRVLGRMRNAGLIPASEIARAAATSVPSRRLAMPDLAAHLADLAIGIQGETGPVRLTLDGGIQHRLEQLARETAARLGPKQSLAMVLADGRTGEILASVGSTGHLDTARSGAIDMTRAVRSPGSALKPFIYGLAFEDALIAAETLIDDRPADFSGYRPRNFDRDYMGEVSIREALQFSLNVPAVRLLEAVGPQRLLARLKRGGVDLQLPPGGPPGLAIGLGGAGISLRGLVQLYTAFVNGGTARHLRDGAETEPGPGFEHPVIDRQAGWRVGRILTGVEAPQGAPRLAIAYKTGTSYGYRDAWAIGFDGRYVLGVWVGRPDASPVPGLSGITTAAPLLFEAFVRSGLDRVDFPPAPQGVVERSRNALPFALRKYKSRDEPANAVAGASLPPRIVYPPQGARVALGAGGEGRMMPLVIKLQGGVAPYRLIANGQPLPKPTRRRVMNWNPDSEGASTLTVMDAEGRAASVSVFIDAN